MNNNAAIVMEGENAGFIDSNGDDALRNLATNSRAIQMEARSFTTAGDFTNADSVVILGDSNFTVSGDLSNSGLVDISRLNPYLLFSDVNFPLPMQTPPALSMALSSRCRTPFSPSIIPARPLLRSAGSITADM